MSRIGKPPTTTGGTFQPPPNSASMAHGGDMHPILQLMGAASHIVCIALN